MRYFIFLTFLFVSTLCYSQYYEPFTYPNGTTSSSTWSTDCSSCSLDASDYFEVRGNQLTGQDLDGPGIFETEWIDLTAYAGPFTLFGNIGKVGDMEGPNTAQSIHHDWVEIEYSLDGGSWVDIKDFLNHGISDSTLYGEDGGIYDSGNDDEWGGAPSQGVWVNGIMADSIKVRITLYNTANTERWSIDDLIIWEEALLPVDFVSMIVHPYSHHNEIKWLTASETNNKGFEVLRSEDGIQWDIIGWVNGNGFSNERITWVFEDYTFKENNYYRIVQVDLDGQKTYHPITYLYRESKSYDLYCLSGRRVHEVATEGIYIKVDPITGLSEQIYLHP